MLCRAKLGHARLCHATTYSRAGLYLARLCHATLNQARPCCAMLNWAVIGCARLCQAIRTVLGRASCETDLGCHQASEAVPTLCPAAPAPGLGYATPRPSCAVPCQILSYWAVPSQEDCASLGLSHPVLCQPHAMPSCAVPGRSSPVPCSAVPGHARLCHAGLHRARKTVPTPCRATPCRAVPDPSMLGSTAAGRLHQPGASPVPCRAVPAPSSALLRARW